MSKEKKTPRIKGGETVTMGKEPGRRGHVGKVLCFWPAETRLSTILSDRVEAGRCIYDNHLSAFDRYLVEVLRFGKTKTLPPAYYAPIAGRLERENPRAVRTK